MEPELAEIDIPTTPIEKEDGGCFRLFIDFLETILLSIFLFLGINAVTARVQVDGFSMYPTLNNRSYVLVNKLSYRSELPEHGDIIVFHYPLDPEQDFIKRVIGLPGDTIEVRDGQVFLNGNLLDEPYIAAPPKYIGMWVVPKNRVFVLGDNRNDSSDSHSWGAVPVENLIGKAVSVYWPPSDWKMIEHIQFGNFSDKDAQ